MNIFKTFVLKWWQVGLLKLAALSFGIILGVYFQEFFLRYIVLVAFACALSGAYVLSVWLKE